MSWKDVLALRAAMERAKARPPEVLRENQQALQLMKQRAAAAEALWAGGHTAEGLSMARDAYEAASAALMTALRARPSTAATEPDVSEESTSEESGPSGGRASLFKRAGVRPIEVSKAEEAYRAERVLLDAEVSVMDARRIKALLKVVRSVERALFDDVRTPRNVVASRLRRGLALLVLVSAGVVGGLLWAWEYASAADAAWIARYYGRANFMGEPQRRNEDEIRFDWGRRSPMVGIPADGFSARFDTCLTVSADQVLHIGSGSDDGARVFVDGIEVLDSWSSQAYTWKDARVELNAGSHHVRVEYFERDGNARLEVQFDSDEEGELVGEFFRPTAPDNGCGETAESGAATTGARPSSRPDRGSTAMNASAMGGAMAAVPVQAAGPAQIAPNMIPDMAPEPNANMQ